MNGDMSLSGTLGALRIANPDDDAASGLSASTKSSSRLRPDVSPLHIEQSSQPQTARNLLPVYIPTGSAFPQRERSPRNETPYNITRRPLESSQSAQPSPQTTGPSSTLYDLPRPRPSSAIYPTDPSYFGSQFGPGTTLSTNGSVQHGTSLYRRASQRDATSATYSLHPPSASSSAANDMSNANQTRMSRPGESGGGYSAEDGPLQSSQAWQDKGVAVSTRQDLDADGRPTARIVKKGVKDFNFGRTLGEGSYSTVLAASDRQTGREYAVKVLDKRHIIKEKKVKYVSIEKDTLNRLTDHPGIVRLYYTFQDERSLYFVLDLASGGELLGVLKRFGTFDLECTRFYSAQILDSISYMHSRGVIHRDLKPENVLLDGNMHTKITDFGTAKILSSTTPAGKKHAAQSDLAAAAATAALDGADSSRAVSFVGTAEYVSPELLTDKNACKASDLWAFGCIVYQLLAGRPPFKAGNEYQTFQKIVALDYHYPDGFPSVARDLISRLLVLDPTRRLTIKQIQEHEFFEGIRWGKGLWKQRAPKLKRFVPHEVAPIKLNDNGAQSNMQQQATTDASDGHQQQQQQPVRAFAELPPPSQLDIDWSSVLTRPNERIVKLGNLDVTAGSGPRASAETKAGDGQSEPSRKFSRLFSGGANKKKQRLVMITSTARILVAAAGGEEKKVKLELALTGSDTTYKSFQDAQGLTAFYVETRDKHYIFEDPRATTSDPDGSKYSTQEWMESFEHAKELALTHTHAPTSYDNDPQYNDIGSSMSSPVMGNDASNDTSGVTERHHLRQTLRKDPGDSESMKSRKHRFSKRNSRSGLAAVF